MVVLSGFCTPVASQEQCSQLNRFTAEAEANFVKAAGQVGPDRCNAFIHYSAAWAETAKYARHHRVHCNISASALSDIDKRHRRAVAERIDVCGGLNRSSLPEGERFPPEIRPRW
jgi:hypothetical protein